GGGGGGGAGGGGGGVGPRRPVPRGGAGAVPGGARRPAPGEPDPLRAHADQRRVRPPGSPRPRGAGGTARAVPAADGAVRLEVVRRACLRCPRLRRLPRPGGGGPRSGERVTRRARGSRVGQEAPRLSFLSPLPPTRPSPFRGCTCIKEFGTVRARSSRSSTL